MSSLGWSEVDCVRKCSTQHVVSGAVGMESDSTLERNGHMRSVIDRNTTLIVIKCEQFRGWARHRKGIIGMTYKLESTWDVRSETTFCLFGRLSAM